MPPTRSWPPGNTRSSAAGVAEPRVIVEGRVAFDFEITHADGPKCPGRRGRHQLLRAHRPPAGEGRLRGELAATGHDAGGARPARREIAKAVTDSLGGQGIFGVELFVKGGRGVVLRGLAAARTTPAWSPWSRNTRASSPCTPAPSLGLPTDVSLREPGASAVIYGGMDAKGIAFEASLTLFRSPAPTCACSASPRATSAAAWAWPWPAPPDTDSARLRAAEAAGRVRPVAGLRPAGWSSRPSRSVRRPKLRRRLRPLSDRPRRPGRPAARPRRSQRQPYFELYWTEVGRLPLWILVDGVRAGFVLLKPLFATPARA